MNAKDFLLSLNKYSMDIRNMESEINILWSFGEREAVQQAENQLQELRKIRLDTLCKVRSALDKLSPTQHDVLLMRFVGVDNDGSGKLKTMTLQEIADRYKKEYTWVTTTQGRALKRLQQIIDEADYSLSG